MSCIAVRSRQCRAGGSDAEIAHLLRSFSRQGKHTVSAGGREFKVTPEMLEIREETQKESGK